MKLVDTFDRLLVVLILAIVAACGWFLLTYLF